MLSLDLHPLFRNNRDIELAMRQFLFRAAKSGEPVAEIIPGKGSGQLRKRVLDFLDQRHIARLYERREIDPKNPGRILIHFRRP
jgi:DNA-nicking Smr family endonuclease